jgi:hypothetical protein
MRDDSMVCNDQGSNECFSGMLYGTFCPFFRTAEDFLAASTATDA